LVCVFVDGCFWHQCPRHKPAPRGGPNAELWRAKFERTSARDRRAIELAEALGYRWVRVWECEINDDVDLVAGRIAIMASA
jgi:DNA mismatch endonuclease (patch repair protein)